MRKGFNFIPLREIRFIKVNKKLIRTKRSISLYTIKKKVSVNFRSKFPSSVKNRNEYNDYDYLHKLNDKEKAWLFKFHREYLNADFKSFKTPLHKTKKLKRTCYDMNNSRTRDLFSRKKVEHKLEYLGDKVFSLIDKGEHF